MSALEEDKERYNNKKESIVSFFRNSPLYSEKIEEEMDFERDKTLLRDIDLE